MLKCLCFAISRSNTAIHRLISSQTGPLWAHASTRSHFTGFDNWTSHTSSVKLISTQLIFSRFWTEECSTVSLYAWRRKTNCSCRNKEPTKSTFQLATRLPMHQDIWWLTSIGLLSLRMRWSALKNRDLEPNSISGTVLIQHMTCCKLWSFPNTLETFSSQITYHHITSF